MEEEEQRFFRYYVWPATGTTASAAFILRASRFPDRDHDHDHDNANDVLSADAYVLRLVTAASHTIMPSLCTFIFIE